MKRTVQMARAGIPAEGVRPNKFKGWRNPHWHEICHIDGHLENGLPILRWEPSAMIRTKYPPA